MIEPPPHRIYLMRHAQARAALPGEKDFDRILDDRGYAEAELVGDRAADLGYKPDYLISSTAARCRQTAETVRKSFRGSLEIQLVDGIYNGTPEIYSTLIAGQTESNAVMLIGHNPTIDHLLDELVGRQQRLRLLPGGYPTATISVLDHAPDNSSPHAWRLADVVRP
jgi:phosphohistidine phosphatase